MNVSQEELHKISPHPAVKPKPQDCTHCGAITTPKIISKQSPEKPSIVVQEAHWICGRCNNRFYIGRIA